MKLASVCVEMKSVCRLVTLSLHPLAVELRVVLVLWLPLCELGSAAVFFNVSVSVTVQYGLILNPSANSNETEDIFKVNHSYFTVFGTHFQLFDVEV
jgi:hypothetical protein